MGVCGVLNVNKPVAMTSRSVVDHVARSTRKTKVGHAGTLDPLASGLLVLCVGPATRLIEYVQRMPKTYTGTFLLGRISPTEDVEGEVRELADPPVPSLEDIHRAAQSLTGQIVQRPPAYSALKVEGKRAYDLARSGKPVHLEPRPVEVYQLEVADFRYPRLTLQIRCSSGTYVRSLGRDLAESLGTGAVMSALVRTAIGGFSIDQSVDLEALTAEAWRAFLLPPVCAVDLLPKLVLSAEEAARIRAGLSIHRAKLSRHIPEWAAVDAAGRLVAVLVSRGPRLWGPTKTLPELST